MLQILISKLNRQMLAGPKTNEMQQGNDGVVKCKSRYFSYKRNAISFYAFVLILCMFTMYVCCISFVFIE